MVDGVELCRDSTITKIERYRVFEKYPARGVHSTASDNCNGAKISLRHTASKTDYVLDVRAYNDGIAFRYVVPGSGSRVPDEGTAFTIPAGSTAWFHDFEGHYEGIHTKKGISEVKPGEWAAPPLTFKLPNGAGYASLTEAALMNYAGMTSTLGLALAATGKGFPFFSAVLGWLGVFLTGSDTSSNALFGNLQVITANALGINPVLTASVNSAAGVMGKMISLQSIAVAVAATGMSLADEGKLFRFTLKHSMFLAVVIGAIALMYAYIFPGYIPVPTPR